VNHSPQDFLSNLRRLGLAILCVSLPALSAAQSFRSTVTYPTTTYPNSIAVGDYNRDGYLDLAIPHFGGPVVVLLGDGNGRFPQAATYTAGSNSGPRASVAADMNRDGRLDLVISNQESSAVSVLIGDGAGHFPTFVRYAAGTLPYFLSTADFNEDGNADIAVANSGSANISVLLGDGAGHLGPQTVYPSGATPRAVIPSDFNGDGHVDLAAANYDDDTVSIFLGQGNGQFTAGVVVATAGGPYLIAAGDVNGDGRSDLVVPNFDIGSVSVFFGAGNGGFNAGPTITTGKSPRHASIADLNGDSHADLVVANRDGSTLSVLMGDGAGTFSAPVNIGVAAGPFSTQIRDFDRDGRLDLATVERDAGSVSIALGEGTGSFVAPLSLQTGGSPRGITSEDFDKDGHIDVAFANNYSKTVTVHFGNGQGGSARTSTFDTGRGPYGMLAADLNADTLPDLVVANGSNNNVSVLLGTGAGAFAVQRFYATNADPRSLAAADFTGDGRPDLVVANYQGNSFTFLRNTGAGVFAAGVATAVGTSPAAIVAADFNGDGFQDVAVANSGSSNVAIFRGNGTGAFTAGATLATSANPSALAARDMNGDGVVDLVVANFGANNVAVFTGAGNGQFTNTFTGAVEAGPLGVGAEDFDGDGIQDIAVVSATASKLSVLKGTGSGYLARKVFSAGLYSRVLTIADFDEDQKPDIAFANTSGDDGWILRNASGVGDLSISINDGVSSAPPGTVLTYLIVAANHGPSDVTGASVTTLIPPGLTGVSWTCTASPGSSCGAAGSGSLIDTVTVKDHGAVTYALTGTVAANAGGSMTLTASVSSSGGDPVSTNNVAQDTDVVGVNHAPVANPQSANATEDTPLPIMLSASDQDNDSLSWSIVSAPAHGALSGSGSAVTYTPAANYSGADSFTFRVNDGFVNSNEATVTIAVAAVNDPPAATPQSVSLAQNSSLGIVLTGTDIENGALTFAIASAPSHGSLSGTGANRTYTPQSGYSGTDSFSFTVNDGVATSPAATVSIVVTPVNSAPVLVTPIADVNVADQSTSTVLNLTATFTDANLPFGDTLTYSTVSNTNPSLVTTSWAGGMLTLGLAAGGSGSATLTVRATDNQGLFAQDTFVVTVTRPQLSVSIADASVTEVNSGTRAMSFVVTLSGAASSTVTAQYATANGTATAGADYNAVSGTVTFAPGTTSQTIVVNTLGDLTDEENEALHVLLSAPSGAAVVDGDGLGTIIDNDQSSLSVNDISVTEGNSGSVVATFTVTMSVPNSRPVTVDFTTTNGVATAGADFAGAAGIATFVPGVTTQTVAVTIVTDALDEANEVFSLTISNPVNATIGRAKGNATIIDDDTPPSVVIGDATTVEGHSVLSVVLTLTLSAPSGQTVKVQFTTADGTAIAGTDYQTRVGEVSFAPGVVTRTIPVTIIGDRTAEASENLFVNLLSGTAVTIADGQAVITINDDDGTP
jgi:uncharacterized repeat protein (TIGR01451 family)